MDYTDISAKFKALGDPTRLQIFECLRGCEGDCELDVAGPTVSQVCCSVTGSDRAPSTMSFHLKELRNAGLILMKRKGRTMVCTINREALSTLAGYFGGGSRCEPGDEQ